ncbi:hypothetical protein GDO86_019411, partial [Hymenochirus boettgeri]
EVSRVPSISLPEGRIQALKVTQQPKFKPIKLGESIDLSCHHDDPLYDYMYWYRQTPGQAFNLMVFSLAANSIDVEDDYKSNWVVERTEVLRSKLTLKVGRLEDSATYFCAVSIHSHTGQGHTCH